MADRPCWKRRRRLMLPCLGLVAPALLVIVLSYLPTTHALLGLAPKRFRYEGLINAGSLGIDDAQLGHVAALGDWNGDSAVDLMTISADGQTLRVHLWDHANFQFQIAPSVQITAPEGRKIVSVIPADYNYDGKLDVLLVMQAGSSSQPATLEMLLFLGAPNSGVIPVPIQVPAASASAQPFSLDATGDMRADLLGHAATQDGSPDANRLKLWKNTMGKEGGGAAFAVQDAPLIDEKGVLATACQLASPHSSAFIDLDGDCLADLFLVCSEGGSKLSYQVWIASKAAAKPTYSLARKGSLPDGAGALTFADIDRDGTIDVVFPSCDGSRGPCHINIAYNKQMPLCSEKRDDWFGVGPGGAGSRNDSNGGAFRCRDTESNLCTADSSFSFDFTVSEQNQQMSRIPLSGITPEERLLLTDDLASPALPVSLTLGDYDRDGYPDIAAITVPKSGRRDETRLRLLRSVPCDGKGAPQAGCSRDVVLRRGRRSFQMMQTGTTAVDNMQDVRRVSFFDIDEDGSLDLLLQRLPDPSSGSRDRSLRRVTFVQNNFFYDAFFLKAMTSNGACSSYCDPSQAGEARYRPWGVNYGGASYKFTVLDTNGVRRAQQVGQLAQTAYQSLQPPYAYFGLGRTNNYVEALFVGVTRRRNNNFVEMEGVIPNSQVVILPWEPLASGGGGDGTGGADASGDASTWRRELYLSPGEWIPWVTVVLVTIVIMLLGFVFVLHLNEKREDERERKRAVHAINFDAL